MTSLLYNGFDIKGILTAWDILIQQKIKALPVDVLSLAEQNNIKVISYDTFCDYYNTDTDTLCKSHSYDGFTICLQGKFVIVINQEQKCAERRRWTIMHELSHIFLGHLHPIEGAVINRSAGYALDKYADRLTSRILAPAVVLQYCGVSSPLEVQKLCGLSQQASEYRYKDLLTYRQNNKFLTNDKEVQVFLQFSKFISQYISNRANQDRYEVYLRAQIENPLIVFKGKNEK